MKRLANLSPAQWAGQIIFYTLVMAMVGYLSDNPSWQLVRPDEGAIKLVVRHSGKLLGECRQLNSAELEELAPNMRNVQTCPREKSPMFIEMSIDENLVYKNTIEPSGLHDDGILALYEEFVHKAGSVELRVRVRDDIRNESFSHILDRTIDLDPLRAVVIEFHDNGFRVIQPDRQEQKTG